MPYSEAGLNAGVNGIATSGSYIGFHTADPGVAGTTAEIAGTRPQTTWAAAASGSRAGSQVTKSIGAGVTVTHWSIWSAASAGTFLGGYALSAVEAFGSAGTLQHTPTLTVANP